MSFKQSTNFFVKKVLSESKYTVFIALAQCISKHAWSLATWFQNKKEVIVLDLFHHHSPYVILSACSVMCQ